MGRKKVVSETAQKLAKALTFVSYAVEEKAETYKAHASIINGYIVTFNGALAIGHPVDEPLSVCPHVPTLIAAIKKAGKTLSIAENEKGNLSVKGDNIRAIVPCVLPEYMPPIMPDMQIATLSDSIKDGFKALLPLCADDETSDKIYEMSILLRANTMVATNGSVIFEYWHGIDLPPGLSVMRSGAKAIASVEEALIGFGWTPGRSATFWFEGGGFIQCRLADGGWPDVDSVFDMTAEPAKLHVGFFDAIEAVAPFSADGAIHFDTDKLRSGYTNYADSGAVYGATYDVPGMVKGSSFSLRSLKLIKPVCDQIDYWSNEQRALFYSAKATGEDFPRIRGVLTKRRTQ